MSVEEKAAGNMAKMPPQTTSSVFPKTSTTTRPLSRIPIPDFAGREFLAELEWLKVIDLRDALW